MSIFPCSSVPEHDEQQQHARIILSPTYLGPLRMIQVVLLLDQMSVVIHLIQRPFAPKLAHCYVQCQAFRSRSQLFIPK